MKCTFLRLVKVCLFLSLFFYFIEILPPPASDRSEQRLAAIPFADGKGVKPMTNSPEYQKTIEHQFDSFCKTVLRNHARTIYADNKKQNERFISLEALTPAQLGKLYIHDTYEAESIYFCIGGYEIPVRDVLMAQAIETLSKRQQDVILLSFFLGMKDVDIAALMNLANSTVHHHKTKALQELRKFMEEQTNEE